MNEKRLQAVVGGALFTWWGIYFWIPHATPRLFAVVLGCLLISENLARYFLRWKTSAFWFGLSAALLAAGLLAPLSSAIVPAALTLSGIAIALH